MTKLWSDGWDYNKNVENHPDWWKHRSRRNEYLFLLQDGTRRKIIDYINEYDIKSILDYGCGYNRSIKNCLHENFKTHIPLTEYDPFVEGKDVRPTGTYDMVMCHNVLGGVEREYVSQIVDDLLNYSNKIVVLKIPVRRNSVRFFIEIIHNAKNKKIREFSIFTVEQAKVHIENMKALGEVFVYYLLEKQ